MNLPKNYIVICENQEETNEVLQSFEEFKNYPKNYWIFWKYCVFTSNNVRISRSIENVNGLLKKENISDYKTFTFKEWKKMKELKMYSIKELEENQNLVVYIDSKKEHVQLSKITDKLRPYFGNYCYNLYLSEYSCDTSKTDAGFFKKYNTTIVHLNQIKELKELFKQKTMQKLTISIQEALEIHKIACSTWKTKIANYLTRVDSNQNITFTQQEIDEMFKAATTEQKPILEKIFGKKVQIDFSKIKTGSKVMLQSTGNIITTKELKLDFTEPFDVIFWKTKHSINYQGEFSLTDNYNEYCTFNQNGKFVKFDSSDKIDFVTEVIKY